MVSRNPLPNLKVSVTGRPADPSPPSPRPSSAIITAATRRRLRASLPPSPLENRVPPPLRPVAWQWRCCSCRAAYDLAVTQRCLLCSHTFCSVNTHTHASITRKRRTTRGGGGSGKRRVDRHGNIITCTTEFDYEGWAAYGAWRRRVTGTQIAEAQRDRRFLLKTQDDWRHCDYPSQCAHRRRELRPVWQDILLGDMSSDEESEPSESMSRNKKKSRRPSTALSPDDELIMNEAISLDGAEKPSTNQQVFILFDDDDSDDDEVVPLDYMPKSQNGLRVRNHGEPDWENFSSDDSESDDEDLVDADGNLVRDLNQSPVHLVKAVNSFWGATDF